MIKGLLTLQGQCRWLSKVSSLVMLTFVVTFGSAANLYVFRLITWRTVLAGLLLPWTGYGLAYGVAWLAGRDARDRLTIAIETGIQNGGIAILVLRFSLGEPESDLTLVMPICVMLFTSVPLWALFIWRQLAKRYAVSDLSPLYIFQLASLSRNLVLPAELSGPTS